MSDMTEIELKLELDPADLARLAESPLLKGDDRRDDRLVSEYYDSADGALATAGFTLRIRRSKQGYVQTVKQEGRPSAGLFLRPEWERPVRRGRPILDNAPFDGLVQAEQLRPLYSTRVERSTHQLAIGDAAIEVAIDRGEVRAGRRRQPIAELELELKAGNPAPLFALARELDALVPLQLGVRSKAERGRALAGGAEPASYKAEAVALAPTMTAGDALAAIASNCLRQSRLNAPLVIANGGVEPVHQARVALRRLRSAFSSFGGLIDDDPSAIRIAGELRWLAAVLGRVRDFDVLLPRLDDEDRERLQHVRAAALIEAQLALRAERARRLMIDLSEWLAIGEWRLRNTALAPIAPLAADVLARHRRRIRRRGRHLAGLDDDRRHRVRIEAKKLRYASEFFAGLWRGKKARRRHDRFVATLEKLQDHLGALNDRVIGAALAARHGIAPPRKAGGRKRRIAKAAKARRALLEPRPFWV